jgi:hypothetical protein
MSRTKDIPGSPPPGGGTAERRERDLKSVNTKLRDLIASLEGQRQQYQRRRSEGTGPEPSPAAPEPEDLEKRRLSAELALAREALDQRSKEEERLRERLQEIEREHRRICDDYVVVEERNTDLASLFVALSRLHGTLERAEVMAAIQEIVTNIVGSEEMAVYELSPGSRELELAWAFGVDGTRQPRVRLGEGVIGRVTAQGEPFVAWERACAEEPALTACIPLKVGERVTGALAIYQLLGHKAVLGNLDRQIFDLLGAHAGAALYFTVLHQRHGFGAR